MKNSYLLLKDRRVIIDINYVFQILNVQENYQYSVLNLYRDFSLT